MLEAKMLRKRAKEMVKTAKLMNGWADTLERRAEGKTRKATTQKARKGQDRPTA